MAAQGVFDFRRQRFGFFGAPLRQNAGVHHQIALVFNQQRLRAQPVAHTAQVGVLENGGEGVVAFGVAEAVAQRQQVQIVVAEHDAHAVGMVHGKQ